MDVKFQNKIHKIQIQIHKIPNHDGCQIGLASKAYKFLDKKLASASIKICEMKNLLKDHTSQLLENLKNGK